jgi:uncharacterized alpha-E superfamily protein
VISRVAESCFWLFRYIERAESCARLVSVNRLLMLDAGLGDVERWKAVIVVLGEQERYEKLIGADKYHDDDTAEEYLTWSDQNPVSIRSNLAWARENARMTREVISREMWETLNTWWQWFNSGAAKREYRKDRSQFYQRIRCMCAEFQGISDNTMLHEEPFDFMRLGMALERANQTARLMDVSHYRIAVNDRVLPSEKLPYSDVSPASDKGAIETPWQSAHWVGQLKLCAADEPFFKRNRAAPTGKAVAAFLLHDPTFPRSVLHCFQRGAELLSSIEGAAQRKTASPSLERVRDMVSRLRSSDIGTVIKSGLHEELTRVVNTAAAVCNQLHDDFFDPTTEPAPELAPARTLELSPRPEQPVASVVRPKPEPELPSEGDSKPAQSQSQSQ